MTLLVSASEMLKPKEQTLVSGVRGSLKKRIETCHYGKVVGEFGPPALVQLQFNTCIVSIRQGG